MRPTLVIAVLLLCACAGPARPAHAQAEPERTRLVEIIGADTLRGAVVGEAPGADGAGVPGERVRALVGNVRLRQDSTLLFADRALEFPERQEYEFVGDVLIIDRGDTLRADRVRYDARTKMGRAEGNLRLADGEVEVFAPSGRYFVDEKRSVFEETVTLVDSATTLTSLEGVYFSDSSRAEFTGDVRLVEPRTRLDADSVTYWREREVAEARGDVRILRLGDDRDEADDGAEQAGAEQAGAEQAGAEGVPAAAPDSLVRTYLFGAYALNDEGAGTSIVEGGALLVRIREDSAGSADTLVVRAARLTTARGDSLQRLTAVGDVRVWQRDLAAVADSAVIDRYDAEPVRDDARFFREPVAWFETSQVTGDTLRIVGRDGSVDSLIVPSTAFVAQEDTATGRIHQLRGERLVGLFEADTLRRVDVGPAAEVIRFRRTDGENDGAIQANATRLSVLFRGGELERVSGYEGIDGTLYAEELLPPDLALPGLRWLPDLRPTKAGLLPPDLLPARTPLLAPEPPAPLVVDDASG